MAGVKHTTAMGKAFDMDQLRLKNEDTIAVGNMNVNARGDKLGAGGKLIKTRNELIRSYNNMVGAPVADHANPGIDPTDVSPEPVLVTPIADTTPPVVEQGDQSTYVKPRGSFADAVASQTDVTQELITPPAGLGGIRRI